MARKSNKKCVLCGQPILDESEATTYKGKRLIHNTCLNSSLSFVKMESEDKLAEKAEQQKKNGKRSSTGGKSTAKPKAELKEPVDEEGYQDKKQFYTYLRMLLNKTESDDLGAKIYAVVKDYTDRYSLSYKQMYDTLVYLHEIIQKDLTGDIVGIIPYYSDEAAKYYSELAMIEEENKDIKINEMYQVKKIITQPRKSVVNKQIDITSI